MEKLGSTALVTSSSSFPTAAALTDNFANPTTTNAAAMNMLWDGATWDRQPGNSAGGNYTQGAVAHDAVDSGNPLKIGGYATDPTSLPTAVSSADRVNQVFSLQGEALTYKSRLDAGEDQTNGVQATGRKQVSVSTYSPTSAGATGSLPGNIKASAGVVKRIKMSNFNASTRYLHLFNSAGAPSGTPFLSMPIGTIGAVTLDFGEEGEYLGTGISLGFSTTATSYTAGAAGDVSYNIQYN